MTDEHFIIHQACLLFTSHCLLQPTPYSPLTTYYLNLLPAAHCNLPTTTCSLLLLTTYCLQQTFHYLQSYTYYQLPTAYCKLFTTHHSLLTTYNLLPAAHCKLLTTHRLLLTTYNLLPTTNCKPPTPHPSPTFPPAPPLSLKEIRKAAHSSRSQSIYPGIDSSNIPDSTSFAHHMQDGQVHLKG
jgi:hypothetical protein